MREILIKGMEMPKEVNHPLFIRLFSDGHIEKGDFLKGGFIETEAKAIEVPTHGRLKDVDEILERDVMNTPIGKVVYPFSIDSAPTVIEASKETE